MTTYIHGNLEVINGIIKSTVDNKNIGWLFNTESEWFFKPFTDTDISLSGETILNIATFLNLLNSGSIQLLEVI